MEVIRISLVHCKPSALTAFPDFQVIFQTPWKVFQKLCLGHINSCLFRLNSGGKLRFFPCLSDWTVLVFLAWPLTLFHYHCPQQQKKGRHPFLTNIWHFLFITRLTIHSHLDWIPLYWDVTTDSHSLQRERLINVNIVTTRTHKSKCIIIGDN